MKKTLFILIALLFSFGAHANFYVGANVNNTDVNYETQLYSDHVSGSMNGAGLTAGWQFHPSWAAEVTHNNLGSASGLNDLLGYSARTTSAWVVGRKQLSLFGYNFYGNARAGVSHVDADARISDFQWASGQSYNPAAGVGLQFPIMSSWSLTTDARITQAHVTLVGGSKEFTEGLTTFTVGIRKDF